MKFQDALNPFQPFLARPGDEPVEEDTTPLTREFDTRLRIDKHSSAGLAPRQPQQQYQQQIPSQSTTANATPTVPADNQISLHDGKTTKKKNGEDDDISDDDNDNDDNSEKSESDDEFDYLLDDDDDDAVLQAIRQKRLKELVKVHSKEAEQKAKGHGEVRTIVQDEFLSECTSSMFVVVHFFHKEFERCKIMDHHLKVIAKSHLSCKFVRIDAEKAPFFVAKLKVRILPTVLVFKDGKTIERLLGFEGLTSTAGRRANDINDFPTSRLGYWLESVGAIEYDGPESDDEDVNDKKRSNLRGRIYDEDI